MSLADDLRKIVKGDVSTAEADLARVSHDASIFELRPEVVVAPHSIEDLKALVKFANKRNKSKGTEGPISLTARSAGTCMSGGPLSDSVVLDFLPYFQGVKSVEVDENGEGGTATALPGTFYRDFEKATMSKNLLLPCYTASKNLNTVGGMVGNNSAGEKTLKYGKTEDYVEELKVVLADGEEYVTKPLTKPELDEKMGQNTFEGKLYKKLFALVEKNKDLLQEAKPKVHKNSAGYYLWNVWDGTTFDINKLIVGSQGTLCLTTEITFKLVKPKTHSALLVIFLHDFKQLADVVKVVLSHKPESFESYDDHTMKLAVRFMPEMIKLMGVGNIIKLGLKFLPEVWMAITGGAPKLVMVAEFTGDSEDEIFTKAEATEKDLWAHEVDTHISKKDAHIAKDDSEEDKYWTIRRESFNLLRKHVRHMHTAPFIDDIIVPPERLPEFMPALTEVFKGYDITYTIAGHIGEGNFHIIPIMDWKRPDFKTIISDLSVKVYDLVVKFGGSITGEHNDGLIRTCYLNKMYKPEVLELFAETKKLFDPQGIFNPRKKVGGSWAYSLEHLRHWPD